MAPKISTKPLKEPKDNAKKADQEPSMAELMERIGSLTSTVEDLRAERDAALSYNPVSEPVIKEPEPQGVDFSGLPDAVEDPEGFQNALNSRIGEAVDRQMQSKQQADTKKAEDDARAAALWEDFKDLHDEWADKEDEIGFVAEKVVRKAKSRGRDLDRYMYGTSQRFFQDVVNEAEKIFGKKASSEPEDLKKEDKPDEDGVDGRTEMFGGLVHGATFGKDTGDDEDVDPKSDMISELSELQQKSGYF